MAPIGMTFKTDARDEIITKALESFSPIAASLGDKEYLVGSGLTVVDFLLWECTETILGLCQDTRLFDAHPNVQAHHARIGAIPAFAAYVASDNFVLAPFTPGPPMTKLTIEPFSPPQ